MQRTIKSALTLTIIILFGAAPALGQDTIDSDALNVDSLEFTDQRFEVRGQVVEVATYKVVEAPSLQGIVLTLDSGIEVLCELFPNPCDGVESGDDLQALGSWHFSSTGRVRWARHVKILD